MRALQLACSLVLATATSLWSETASADSLNSSQVERLEAAVRALEAQMASHGEIIGRQAQTIEDLQATVEAQALRLHDVMGDDEWSHYREEIDARLKERESAFGPQFREFDNRMQRIHVGAGLTATAQGLASNTSAIRDDGGNRLSEDPLDGAYSFDLILSSPIGPNALAYVALEGGQGTGIDDEVSAFHGFNDDALGDDGSLNVLEAYLEFLAFNDELHAVFGKIDTSNYVDENEVANDETTQFLSPGFVNSIALEFPEDNSLGVHAFLNVVDGWQIHFGMQETDADYEDIFSDPFLIGELHIRSTPLQRPGNYHVYLWHNGEAREPWDGGGREENWGAGISLDQEVTDRASIFARAGFQNEDVAEVAWAWSAGLQVVEPLHWLTDERPSDVWALALGHAVLSDEYKRTTVHDEDEWMLETYYALHLRERWVVSPHVQAVVHPGGESQSPMLTAGVRSQMDF